MNPDSTAARVIAELERRGKVTRRGNTYRCNSPLRAGSDSMGFCLTITDTDGEHGTWYDHAHPDDKGSLYQLAERLGIAQGTPAPAPEQPTVYHSLAEYCGDRYLQAFTAAGWKEVQHQHRPALAYPTDTGTRHRFIDGSSPKYTSPPGYMACWYKLPEAVKLAAKTGQPLVICNGESSVVTAQAERVAATCLTSGEGNVASKLADRQTGLLGRLLEVYPVGSILLAFDCDPAGRKASRAVLPVLTAAGYDVRAVDLQLGEKQDLRDLARLHQEQTAAQIGSLPDLPPEEPTQAELPAPAGGAARQPPRLIALPDLMKKHFPPIKWAIEGVLPEGCFLLTGAPKMGKSFLVLGWCLAVASAGGKALGGIDVTQGDVLYLALEDNERRLQERVKMLLDDQSAPTRVTMATEWARLDEGGATELELWCMQHPDARLIVIDTLARIRPRKRRSNVYEDDYNPIAQIKQISDKYGVTVVIVHHNRKGVAGSDVFESVSGSQGLGAAADGYLLLQRARGEATAVLSIVGRDVPDKELALQFQPEICHWHLLGDAAEYNQSEERREVLELLETPYTAREAAEELKKSRQKVHKHLKALLESGLITQNEDGRYIKALVSPPAPPVTGVTPVTPVTTLHTTTAQEGQTETPQNTQKENIGVTGVTGVTTPTHSPLQWGKSCNPLGGYSGYNGGYTDSAAPLPPECLPPPLGSAPSTELAERRAAALAALNGASSTFIACLNAGDWEQITEIIAGAAEQHRGLLRQIYQQRKYRLEDGG